MGIRTKSVESEKVTSEPKGYDVTVAVDNGGGGGDTYPADIYFKFNGKIFQIPTGTPTDPSMKPDGKTSTDGDGNVTVEWEDQPIKKEGIYDEKTGETTYTPTNCEVKIRYKPGEAAADTVTAWATMEQSGVVITSNVVTVSLPKL